MAVRLIPAAGGCVVKRGSGTSGQEGIGSHGGTCRLRQVLLLALKEALVKLGWQLADNGAALKAPTTGASDSVVVLRYVFPKKYVGERGKNGTVGGLPAHRH